MINLLDVKDLKMHFPVRKGLRLKAGGYVKAVDGVNFSLGKGETLGLVGESGCGKTTVSRSLLRLIEPTGGQVFFEGEDILQMSSQRLRKIRADIQIIFSGSLLVFESTPVHRGDHRRALEKIMRICPGRNAGSM